MLHKSTFTLLCVSWWLASWHISKNAADYLHFTWLPLHQMSCQHCGQGWVVRVPRSPGFGFELESESSCFIWTKITFCCSLFDFCSICFMTKILLVHHCTLLCTFYRVSLKSSLSTQTLHPGVGVWFFARSWSPGFSRAGVEVRSPKFSNSGVWIPQKNKESASLIVGVCVAMDAASAVN